MTEEEHADSNGEKIKLEQRVHDYLEAINPKRFDQFGRYEYSLKNSLFDSLKGLALTIPWKYMTFQLLWTCTVIGIGYGIGDKSLSTLSYEFWNTKLSVSSDVTFGVGWALFVFLGFLISAASGRYYQAQKDFAYAGTQLSRILRIFCQAYKKGIWHEKDFERIVAHMIAYPICLKMQIRGERDATQLQSILHDGDVNDVLKSEYMHLQCSRVIRAYISHAEHTACNSKNKDLVNQIGGWSTRFFGADMVDSIDGSAASAMRIVKFQPSVGYVNHLRIYLYIWMMFLPLSLISHSGWFTLLWSLLIGYFVSMILVIARALNEPYGFDVHDIKLNAMCVAAAKRILQVYSETGIYFEDVIDQQHQTPTWLEKSLPPKLEFNFHPPKTPFRIRPPRAKIMFFVSMFTLWTAFIIVLTWFLTRNEPRAAGVRWWTLYIPLTTSTTSFVSVGLFLLIGFWVNDAYGRYWEGLQTWQTKIRPAIENVALHLAILHKKGAWHERDRERVFSFLAALPYVAKMMLRGNFSNIEQELSDVLSTKDIQSIKQSSNPLFFVFSTIHGYIHSADAAPRTPFSTLETSPYVGSTYCFMYSLWSAETSMDKCLAIKIFPISVAFTAHLRLFTAFWLALVPLSVVTFGGFTSFAYLIPLAYAVINLLILGDELCDPFGEDRHDIPLGQFAKEIGNSVHRIYHDTLNYDEVIQPNVVYNRESFKSMYHSVDKEGEEDDVSDGNLSPKVMFKQIIEFLPKVSILAMLAVFLWTVGATFLSWRLSILWHDDLNVDQVYGWNSPIDVNPSITGSIGFALFLMLAFACSDGISRYDTSARILYELEKQLTSIASFVLKNMKDHSFHEYDKERIVAHLLQIPICLKNILLERKLQQEDTFLNDNDFKKYKDSTSSLDYLINSLHSYAISHDIILTSVRKLKLNKAINTNLPNIILFSSRFHSVRSTIKRAIAIKRFPIVESYKLNQRIFVGIWLFILPFTMTASAGFFTILWVPLIAYGILGMQEIAERLVDPLGDDQIDVPVNQLCDKMVKSVLQIANSSEWDCYYHIKEIEIGKDNSITDGQSSHNSYDAQKKQHIVTISDEEKYNVTKDKSNTKGASPSLFSHLVRSVPWWKLSAVTIWTGVACLLSYFIRRRKFDATTEWWVSYIAIDTNVVAYMSTAAFSLLGFYVNAAHQRYASAGAIWTEKLRSTCHDLARGFGVSSKKNGIHKNDHDRIIGHIIALPLVLKQQLKGSKDIGEVKQYLGHEDVGRIGCSDCMVTHCCEVLRTYMLRIECRNDDNNYEDFLQPGLVAKLLQTPLNQLEDIISEVKYLNEFSVPQGFRNLLDVLLYIWFLILPFALVTISGWFTILWIIFISYSVFGIHLLAIEIEHPFGEDLNDFNLEEMANRIVTDVIAVNNVFSINGLQSTITEGQVPKFWKTDNQDENQENDYKNTGEEKNSIINDIKQSFSLSFHIINWWTALVYLVWVGFAVSLSYVVQRYWPFFDDADLEARCLWFCSKIAVSSSALTYIGFALFLLLGFQIYDSHGRYVEAVGIWQQDMLHLIGTSTNRILESMTYSCSHEHDIHRLIGHLAAFPICLMGALRDVDYKEKLLEVLNQDDVDAILASPEKADHCHDVIWSYINEGFRLGEIGAPDYKTSPNEQTILLLLVLSLKSSILRCQQIIKIPLPHGYIRHLKIFITIYLLILPFGLVESSGWVAILWCMFIAYGAYGAERWSSELADPFGYDLSDIPLEKLCDSIISTVKDNYVIFKDHLHSTESRFDSLIVNHRIEN